jgi:hypothetical protein
MARIDTDMGHLVLPYSRGLRHSAGKPSSGVDPVLWFVRLLAAPMLRPPTGTAARKPACPVRVRARTGRRAGRGASRGLRALGLRLARDCEPYLTQTPGCGMSTSFCVVCGQVLNMCWSCFCRLCALLRLSTLGAARKGTASPWGLGTAPRSIVVFVDSTKVLSAALSVGPWRLLDSA